MGKPKLLYMLTALLILQSVSALYGGVALVIKPDGSLLQLPLAVLKHPVFSNFLVPGLALALLLGIFPLIAVIGLLLKPSWRWAGILNINKQQHWALTYALYTGIMLVFFINVELIITETYLFLQPACSLLGLLIIVLCVSPPLLQHFGLPNDKNIG